MRKSSSLLALAAWLLSTTPLLAAADDVITPELTAAYRAVLADPTNTALNLEYARIAESLGQDRKALSAYERILINDPGNRDAELGLQRIRRRLQPPFTKYVFQGGVAVESNPRHVASGEKADVKGKAGLTIRDERVHWGHRWRTDLRALGEWYVNNGDLDYAYAGGNIGPMFDFLPRLSAQPFVGGGAATLGGDYYYSEGIFGVLFEGQLEGAYQSLRVRGGYRSYGEDFTSDQGFYADVTGKFTHPDIFSDRDVFMFEPIARWSGIDGTGLNANFEEVQPGRYLQWSTEFSYYNRVMDWLTLGAGVKVGQIFYQVDKAPSGAKRQDLSITPMVSMTFNNLLKFGSDLEVQYKYDWNDSNDPAKDFDDHIGTARVVHRF